MVKPFFGLLAALAAVSLAGCAPAVTAAKGEVIYSVHVDAGIEKAIREIEPGVLPCPVLAVFVEAAWFYGNKKTPFLVSGYDPFELDESQVTLRSTRTPSGERVSAATVGWVASPARGAAGPKLSITWHVVERGPDLVGVTIDGDAAPAAYRHLDDWYTRVASNL